MKINTNYVNSFKEWIEYCFSILNMYADETIMRRRKKWSDLIAKDRNYPYQ